ncbi:putative metal-binding motif-containing protein [Myxococcus fulvus]|uniref:putative metal-binding motif-containing protein n=1 Tax=Myxococcus fulvus TaxID=33 RepID=UPI003B9CA4A6
MMRLFLVGVGLLTLSMTGCKSKTSTNEGGLRVFITYATFRPKCLTLAVVDRQDDTRWQSGAVTVDPEARSDTRIGVVLKQEGWSPDLRVTAEAHEGSCDGPVIARQSADVQFPKENVTDLKLDLRAEDLDDDGFLAMKGDHPGTDCDDTRADVHPGATEVCDGVDNNCVAGESDAPGDVQSWVDVDGDGYGDASTPPQVGCGAPAGYATRGGDCKDDDALVHPGQEEFRCDGKDDNCDNQVDNDPFNVGDGCSTSNGCAGVVRCGGPDRSLCQPSLPPVTFFADDDGDGQNGTLLGLNCAPPEPGATQHQTDCDDGTARVSSVGVTEVCDRLDNNCNLLVDDGLPGCAAVPWVEQTVLDDASARYDAVANYGTGRGWLAGGNGRVIHVDGDTFTPATDCAGDWRAAWSAPNGRVFLGSSDGRFATLMPDELGGTCETQASGQDGALNGLVGFPDPQSNVITVYAVSSQGHVLSWSYDHGAGTQPTPTVVTRLAANLRDIDGLRPQSLIVVGAEMVNGEPHPAAWLSPQSGTAWTREELNVSPTATGTLNAVQVLTPRLAYAMGDQGLILQKTRDRWALRTLLTVNGSTTPSLRAFIAFGRTGIYVVAAESDGLHFFNGFSWSIVATPSETVTALGGFGPGEVWATGHDGLLTRWKP